MNLSKKQLERLLLNLPETKRIYDFGDRLHMDDIYEGEHSVTPLLDKIEVESDIVVPTDFDFGTICESEHEEDDESECPLGDVDAPEVSEAFKIKGLRVEKIHGHADFPPSNAYHVHVKSSIAVPEVKSYFSKLYEARANAIQRAQEVSRSE